MNVPRLRFKAKDGSDFPEWEEKQLKDLFRISAGGDIDKKNCSRHMTYDYSYPVYANALSNKGLYGYANYFKIEGDTFTVTGRGEVGYAVARHEKYVPIVRLLVCEPKENDDVDFFAEQINAATIFVESTGVPQLTAPQLGNIKVKRPSIIEQRKIATFLSTIDEIIATTEAEVSAWQERKKGVMQKLFSQKVRFKADNGSEFPEWEEKKLGEITKKIVRKADCNSTADVRMISQGNGFILQSDKYSRENAGNSLKKYTLLKKNEFAYNHGASKMKPYGVCYRLIESDEARVPYVYHTFKFIIGNEVYWNYALNTEIMDRQLKKMVSSGVRMDGLLNISYETYMSVQVLVPSLPEQQKIADCLSSFDDVINQTKAELAAWQEFKKGLLQQMFV